MQCGSVFGSEKESQDDRGCVVIKQKLKRQVGINKDETINNM